jgi:hypothetical protein
MICQQYNVFKRKANERGGKSYQARQFPFQISVSEERRRKEKKHSSGANLEFAPNQDTTENPTDAT